MRRYFAVILTVTGVSCASLLVAAGGSAAAPATAAAERAQPKAVPTFVMVGFGDSYGSGEGAPEQPGSYSYNTATGHYEPTSAAVWTKGGSLIDDRCHRSPNSGLNQAADLLRRTFAGKVNVVFKNFACSGASVRYSLDGKFGGVNGSPDSGGILTPYKGMGPQKDSYPAMDPQVTQANQWLASNKYTDVGAVLVNIGGNDAGFGRMLALCAVNQYLAPLGVIAGSDDCAKELMGAPLPNAKASQVIDLLDGPRTYDLGLVGEAFAGLGVDPETLTSCTSLTPDEADRGVCHPTLEASYRLLASALTYPKAKIQTFTRCSPVEESLARGLVPSAKKGDTAFLPNGVTCTRQVNGWTKVAHEYPALSTPAYHVYLDTYPTQPLTFDDGSTCNSKPTSDALTSKITGYEARLFQEQLVSRLNGVVSEAVQWANNTDISRQWTAVRVGSAYGHGICASANQRWFNLNSDALSAMGEEIRVLNMPGKETVSSGWAHPNAKGFLNIYQWPIAEQVRLQICSQYSLNPCPALVGKPGVNADAALRGTVRGIDGPAIVGADVSLANDSGAVVAVTHSDSAGAYEFTNLMPGSYTVTATPPAASTLGSYTPSSGAIYVQAKQSATLNLWLDKGAAVSGIVQGPGGVPLAGVTVQAYSVGVNFPNDRPSAPVATTVTDASGSYRFLGLPPASLVRFRYTSPLGATPHYRSTWYRNGATWADASVVPLEESDVKTLEAVTLQVGPDVGTISGSVITEEGSPAEGAQVMARTSSGETVATALADQNGDFVLENVPAGSVFIRFGTAPSSDWYSFRESWYPGVLSRDLATPVEVLPDEETALPSALTLAWGADVSVFTNDADSGDGVSGIPVTLLDEQGNSWTGRTMDRRYDFRGLPPGRYRVVAQASGDYLTEWFEGVPDASSATWLDAEAAFTVTAPIDVQKVPDEVDADAAALPTGFTLSWARGVGGDSYDIERALGSSNRFSKVVYGLMGSRYVDASTKAKKARSACYRIRAVASTGAMGPWSMACATGRSPTRD